MDESWKESTYSELSELRRDWDDGKNRRFCEGGNWWAGPWRTGRIGWDRKLPFLQREDIEMGKVGYSKEMWASCAKGICGLQLSLDWS